MKKIMTVVEFSANKISDNSIGNRRKEADIGKCGEDRGCDQYSSDPFEKISIQSERSIVTALSNLGKHEYKSCKTQKRRVVCFIGTTRRNFVTTDMSE